MMELVNGIPCFNCTDVERAKKNGGEVINTIAGALPASRIEQARLDQRDHVAESQKTGTPRNENRLLTSGPRGAAVNMLA